MTGVSHEAHNLCNPLSGAPELVGGGLRAQRNDYRYGVTYEPPEAGDPGRETPAGEKISAEDAQVLVKVSEEPGGGFPK